MKPSERDVEKAQAIVNDWYEGWLKCPTWTDAFQRYGAQEISKALAAERASLPESVIEKLNKIATWDHWCDQPKCTCRQDMAHLALADLKSWQDGK